MAWGPFSAEAIKLDSQLRTLHEQGRTSAALDEIKAALEAAWRSGPSNTSYEQFERTVSAAQVPSGPIRWQKISTIPLDRKDGRQVYVKRMHEGRLVSEGWAVFGEWHPNADYVQPDPSMNWDVKAAKAERRWLRPDRMYAFPEPTHYADINPPLDM